MNFYLWHNFNYHKSRGKPLCSEKDTCSLNWRTDSSNKLASLKIVCVVVNWSVPGHDHWPWNLFIYTLYLEIVRIAPIMFWSGPARLLPNQPLERAIMARGTQQSNLEQSLCSEAWMKETAYVWPDSTSWLHCQSSGTGSVRFNSTGMSY